MDVYDNLKLDEADLLKFSTDAQDWAQANGIVMRNREQPQLLNFAPFMLFPTPFPKYLYDEAMLVQKDFQTLAHLASLDSKFIEESLKSVILHDDFTKRQYDIYTEVKKGGFKPKFYFNITRSDYMIDKNEGADTKRPYEIKQIEINMIAASFAGLCTKVGRLHKFLGDVMHGKAPFKKENLPNVNTIGELGAGLAKCWQYYNVEDAVIVFVVMEGECNRIDQRLLEYSFYENLTKLAYKKHVPVLFRSLQQIQREGKLSDDNRFLLEGKEVALFYFRAGYTPGCYNDAAWEARLLIEKSVAVKCPTVAEQLIGTKKVQQIFALPGMVEKFIKNGEAVKRIRRTFAGLYTLDPGPEGDASAKLALDDPGKYVLKPQREGGGNNMYDGDLVNELKRITDPAERSQYILMERVRPPVVKNYIVHVESSKPSLADTITELGIFGIFISDGEQEILNSSSGFILRTKDIAHDDGGVAAGRAVLDTPYLV